jgi:hypothetical protein
MMDQSIVEVMHELAALLRALRILIEKETQKP